jgi:catechol 2,3-dioxygenase-like lactoylglutathione lyase family enzyme
VRAIILLIFAVTVAVGCDAGNDRGGNGGGEGRDAPIAAAKAAYAQAKRQGVEMANGPCLGTVAEDWVADVAHDPRQPVDDEPANQCEAYKSGAAHHFVELDPDGNLIRAQ